MANNDIIELLDILYGMVTEAWSVPLGNDKCIIEREKAIEIINEIKNSLPTAIAEAQRLEAKSKELRRVASEYVDDLMRQTEQSMTEALSTIRGAHESFQALGGGIAQQPAQPQQAVQQMRQQGQPVKQAAAQSIYQGTPVRQQQPQRREPDVPQGKADPLSTKIQRIERDSE